MRRKLSVLVGLFGILMLFSMTSAWAQSDAFKDINWNHWAWASVLDLSDKGILEGYPGIVGDPMQRYRGRRPLTRAEFTVAMKRFLDKLVPTNQPRRQSLVDELNREIVLALEETAKYAEAPDVPLPKTVKAVLGVQKRAKKR
jgi:hypothetical protein